MKKIVKTLLCLMLAFLVVVPTAAFADDANEPIVLELLINASGKSDDVQRYAEEFEAQTGIKVNVTPSPGGNDYKTKVSLLLPDEDNCPDIIYEDGQRVKTDSAAGLLTCLDDKVAAWDEWSHFSNLKVASEGADGRTYAVPLSTDVQLLWYNADVFEGAGLDPNWQPETWEDIFETANKLKEAYKDDPDFIPLYQWVTSASFEATSMRTFQVLYEGVGGNCYNYETSQWVFDKPNMTKVLEFVNRVWNIDELGNLDIAVATDADNTMCGEILPDGKVGIYFTGNYCMKNGIKMAPEKWASLLAENKIRFAYIPSENGERYVTTCGGWTWAIPENAKHKDAAWEFIQYITTKEHVAENAINNALPSRDDSWTTDVWTNQDNYNMIEGFQKALDFAKFRDSVDGYNSVSLMYATMVENVAFNLMTIDDALENFKTELIGLVGEEGVQIIE